MVTEICHMQHFRCCTYGTVIPAVQPLTFYSAICPAAHSIPRVTISSVVGSAITST